VALVRNLYGDLDSLPPEQRNEWLDYLIAGQDEETGLYIDPIFKSEERTSAQHTDELLFWHSTTFILSAVKVLGGMPKYPVSAVHDILTPKRMVSFIERLPWEQSTWVVGNWTYGIGSLVAHDYGVTQEPANLEAMDAFFDWHDSHQLPDTGWWDLGGNQPVRHQQYGGYHTLMVYWMYDRPVRNPDKMIESTLSLQTPEGHFGGGCCEDMDAVDTAVSLCRQYGLCQGEVADAMARALPWLLEKQIPGGGFIDGEGVSRSEFGWKQCTAELSSADPCSDYFRSFSIALCSEVLPGTELDQIPWRHHGTYGHGVRPRCLL
jgi:hypothetical protein